MSVVRSGRLICGLLLGASVLALAGCASGPKLERYVAPAKPAEQLARVEGGWGAYITIVDNKEVAGTLLQFGNVGGNHVMVEPGLRRITVNYTYGNHYQTYQETFVVEHDFLAGHVYKVGPDQPLNPFNGTLSLEDKTNNTKRILN
jgi:hypothetical protein